MIEEKTPRMPLEELLKNAYTGQNEIPRGRYFFESDNGEVRIDQSATTNEIKDKITSTGRFELLPYNCSVQGRYQLRHLETDSLILVKFPGHMKQVNGAIKRLEITCETSEDYLDFSNVDWGNEEERLVYLTIHPCQASDSRFDKWPKHQTNAPKNYVKAMVLVMNDLLEFAKSSNTAVYTSCKDLEDKDDEGYSKDIIGFYQPKIQEK